MLTAFSATFFILSAGDTAKNAFVRGVDGREYSAEEYIELLESGIDITRELPY